MDLRFFVRLRANKRRISKLIETPRAIPPKIAPVQNDTANNRAIDVAVGLISQNKKILISRRHTSADQGGLWEFPGGKIQTGESAAAAIDRELFEELGIRVTAKREKRSLVHHYAHLTVTFDLYEIVRWTGYPYGKEEQEIRWIEAEDFGMFKFPEANYRFFGGEVASRDYLASTFN